MTLSLIDEVWVVVILWLLIHCFTMPRSSPFSIVFIHCVRHFLKSRQKYIRDCDCDDVLRVTLRMMLFSKHQGGAAKVMAHCTLLIAPSSNTLHQQWGLGLNTVLRQQQGPAHLYPACPQY